ncbi:hypothetical protein [Nocardia fluminea]|uniref:hypothetical protein n=1 Tax=Nocardia fluminea TaxID=134984 RepID=UPI0036472575
MGELATRIPVQERLRYAVRRLLCQVRCAITIVDSVEQLARARPILESRGWRWLGQAPTESGAEATYVRTIRVARVPKLIDEAIARQARRVHVLLTRNFCDAEITAVTLRWPRLTPEQPLLQVHTTFSRSTI